MTKQSLACLHLRTRDMSGALKKQVCMDQGKGSTTGRLGIACFFWFVTSTIFNDVTPRLMRTLMARGGDNIDVTVRATIASTHY